VKLPSNLNTWRAQIGSPATYKTRAGDERMGVIAAVETNDAGEIEVKLRFERSDLLYEYAPRQITGIGEPREATPRIDATANPEVRQELAAFITEHPAMSPRIDLDQSEALAPADPKVNCVGYAIGKDEWVDLGLRQEAYKQALTSRGFIELDDVDTRVVDGYEKVAVYGFAAGSPGFGEKYSELARMLPVPPPGWDMDDWLAFAQPRPDDGIVTHVAVQSPSGAWESKLGAGPVVRVPKAEDFGGGDYGEPVAVFIRRRSALQVRS
jgi:hypothetical protein